MSGNRRSRTVTQGVQRSPNRALLRAVGFGDGDFDKPIVGVANAHSTVTPCNSGLGGLAAHAEAALKKAGAMPQMFGTITISDGISMGTEGMKFSLVSREVIADSIETVCSGQSMDGVLAIGGCDKNMPGAMIAIARMNIPAIFIYGGTIKPGHYKGRDFTIVSAFEAVGEYTAHKIDEQDLLEIERRACPGAGSCGGMFTANTMSSIFEAMGMSLPYSSTMANEDEEKAVSAAQSAEVLVNAIKKQILPQQILTRAAFENAIAMAMAVGGSTNAVLHLLAIAHAMKVPLTIDDFETIRARVPVLCDIKPSGRYVATDLHRAGGIPQVMKILLAHGVLHGDIVVIRYEGPKGGPGMREMLSPTSTLVGAGLGDSVGLITALVAIPDGIASVILAGLNPIHGLYALMIGTPIAAMLASSHFMYVANTGALVVATGSALGEFGGEAKVQALIVLVVLVGLLQLALGLLRLGGLVRFVANAVLIGFMTGIAVHIIMSQLGELNGYHAAGGNAIMRTLDWIGHLHLSDPWSSAIGLGTLALIVLLNRTRAAQLAMAIALVVATLGVWLAGLDSVATLNDTALIPGGFPALVLPQWSLVAAVFPAAAALAIIGLVQGAGVSKTIPNPDGSYPNISRDFSAKGVANIASGLFQGMPIGGAMSETAVSLKAGARSRWAGIFSGGFIILAVLLLADGVGYLAMPAIAALLVMAGIEAIKPARIGDVWHSGWEPRVTCCPPSSPRWCCRCRKRCSWGWRCRCCIICTHLQ